MAPGGGPRIGELRAHPPRGGTPPPRGGYPPWGGGRTQFPDEVMLVVKPCRAALEIFLKYFFSR